MSLQHTQATTGGTLEHPVSRARTQEEHFSFSFYRCYEDVVVVVPEQKQTGQISSAVCGVFPTTSDLVLAVTTAVDATS